MKTLRISRDNYEKHENIITLRENHENHKKSYNSIIELLKSLKKLVFDGRIKKCMKTLEFRYRILKTNKKT